MQDLSLSCFKAYDLRGKVPKELNPDLAFKIGLAYATVFNPRTVAVGYDVRLSSPSLRSALIEGLNRGGADVKDIGLCGTEEIYHAVFNLGLDGGIMITASHNPKGYNGMKFVRQKAIPVSGDSGLNKIKELILKDSFHPASSSGLVEHIDNTSQYIAHLLSYVSLENLHPLKIVVDPGNGGAGKIVDFLEEHLPFNFVKINYEPDGDFPNGVPNPLLFENRAKTSQAVVRHKADMGIAWDGDFDRCFFFDENGEYIEGYYLVGLLAKMLLEKYPGEKILHDPRLTWNTREIVLQHGGVPLETKTGHAFIKERMRAENAVYGGEMSSHHYFRGFSYCDSGMIPWLLVAELLSVSGKKISEFIADAKESYPSSGEINRRVEDSEKCFKQVREEFQSKALAVTEIDGMSFEFADWRFNLRTSNTEPVIRLNVESRGNTMLMERMTEKILNLIDS
ncbi:phosphomannomutase [Maridesulfovibrio ferrireducens]|uniref:Phosphomannomutase n=1 Tax=Maridesulfovibrio ferrireducens TaxID=246191 RepID=A0A1G9ESR4_9BACT|nr:phosphomannomutase [Maridesulfovibrio ferrireducens]SDK79144.1 phosphomannomutase [Maridesulfovibrio ferrireducens]